MDIDTITAIINDKYVLYNPLKYNVAIIIAIPGIGKPINPSVSSDITLYLVNLKTPQIIMNNDTIPDMTVTSLLFIEVMIYRNIAGATPKDIMSDSESIFLPNPYSSFLLVFRATHPSIESNINENIINIAARRKLWFIDSNIDMNPELIFIKDIKSDIAMKFCIFVFIVIMLCLFLFLIIAGSFLFFLKLI